MFHRILADAVLLLHFGFVAFVALGVVIVWRWPRLAWLHLPALGWGAYAVIAGAICPLTPLENALRAAGGGSTYDVSFIEHYLLPLVYPDFVQGETGRTRQIGVGIALVVFNAIAYALIVRRSVLRKRRGGNREPQQREGT